jgi:hypothetical protein
MANWSNLRLTVTGYPADIAAFRVAAGRAPGRIDASRSRVFTEDMEYGEGGDLQAGRMTRVAGDLRRISYKFQGRNDDHADHFRNVSRHYPRLAFVLVVSDPNSPGNGSFFLWKGRIRWWNLPDRLHDELFVKHLRKTDVVPPWVPVDFDTLDYDDAEVDMAYWDAMFEGMDLAELRWESDAIEWIRGLPAAKTASGKAVTPKSRARKPSR